MVCRGRLAAWIVLAIVFLVPEVAGDRGNINDNGQQGAALDASRKERDDARSSSNRSMPAVLTAPVELSQGGVSMQMVTQKELLDMQRQMELLLEQAKKDVKASIDKAVNDVHNLRKDQGLVSYSDARNTFMNIVETTNDLAQCERRLSLAQSHGLHGKCCCTANSQGDGAARANAPFSLDTGGLPCSFTKLGAGEADCPDGTYDYLDQTPVNSQDAAAQHDMLIDYCIRSSQWQAYSLAKSVLVASHSNAPMDALREIGGGGLVRGPDLDGL